MKRDLGELLDQCISQLNSGVDIETVLASYPEEAAELRPLLRTVARIREVPDPVASAEAKARGKRQLLRAVAAKRRAMATPKRVGAGLEAARIWGQVAAWLGLLLQPPAPLRRLAVTVATLALVITMTGWGVTLAAANSLPDSPLYPVKLVAEQIRLTLTTSSTAKAQIQLDRAEERLKELRALIEAGRGADEAAVKAVQLQSQAAWQAITQAPEGVRQGLLSEFGDWAQESQAELKAAGARLSPQEQVALDEAIKALSHDAARAEKALGRTPTPSPTVAAGQGESTTLPEPAGTATEVPTQTATAAPTQTPVRATDTATAVATPVPPTATPTPEELLQVAQPDLKPTWPPMPTWTATATPAHATATPMPGLTATATPPAASPTPTPTPTSEITAPPIGSTPVPAPPTPTPEETPQVEQPPVQATTVPLLPTPTPTP